MFCSKEKKDSGQVLKMERGNSSVVKGDIIHTSVPAKKKIPNVITKSQTYALPSRFSDVQPPSFTKFVVDNS